LSLIFLSINFLIAVSSLAISYTVSPEYFTQFKFHQFGILRSIPDRLGAAIVGWQAAWWMGIFLIPVGLVIRGNGAYFWGMTRVFGVVTLTTMIFGLAALALAYCIVDPETIGEIARYGNDITDDAAFMRAGTMHNFSYLGGLVGIIAGGIAIYLTRARQKRNTVASYRAN